MSGLTVTNAMLILPDRIIERGTARVDDGVITIVEEGPPSSRTEQASVIDARGAYLMPGVVDLHNDALEFEINPRPRANLPLPFALAALERRLIAAGVTTEFHAIMFMDREEKARSVADAVSRAAYIADLPDRESRAVRHEVLHRLDVRSPDLLAPALERLDGMHLRFASLNDHTPGQGQFRDVDLLVSLAEADAERMGLSATDKQWYRDQMDRWRSDQDGVPAFYNRIAEETRRNPIVLATHDDDTEAKVDAQAALGATIAEFPVTMQAAQRCRDHGMTIVVGAPNVLRGGSQSGNLSAIDLIAAGLADAICADYHAPCLIPAAFRIAQQGIVDLPAAIRMITETPARAVGLPRLGAIREGYVADLALVRLDREDLPQIEATVSGGRLSYHYPLTATRAEHLAPRREQPLHA